MRLHEIHRKNRIDDIGHQQGGQQGDDQGYRKKVHEFPNDPIPESQWDKGNQSGQGAGQHGKKYFSGGRFGGFDHGDLAIIENPVRILNDHNSVIHHDTQGQQEGKQHDHIQAEVQRRHNQKSNSTGKGDGQGYEKSVGHTHEEHEDDGDQKKADDDGVDQVMKGCPGHVGLVPGDHDVQIGRQDIFLHLFQRGHDIVGGVDEVFSPRLDHIQGDYVFVVQARIALLLFKVIHDIGYVPKIYGLAAVVFHDHVADFFGRLELIADAENALLVVHGHLSGCGGNILHGYRHFDVLKSEPRGSHPVHVHIDLNLPFQGPDHVHSFDFFELFELILNQIGIFFQSF